MNIRVFKAEHSTYWYANRIGETFEVIPDINAENYNRYRVKMKRPHIGHFYVHTFDCEVVEKEGDKQWLNQNSERKIERSERMKKGECSICEGWIAWDEALVEIKGKQYCEACYKDTKEKQ